MTRISHQHAPQTAKTVRNFIKKHEDKLHFFPADTVEFDDGDTIYEVGIIKLRHREYVILLNDWIADTELHNEEPYGIFGNTRSYFVVNKPRGAWLYLCRHASPFSSPDELRQRHEKELEMEEFRQIEAQEDAFYDEYMYGHG